MNKETIDKLIELGFPIKTNISALPSFEDIWKELPISIEYNHNDSKIYTLFKMYLPDLHFCYGTLETGWKITLVPFHTQYYEESIIGRLALLWCKLKEMGLI